MISFEEMLDEAYNKLNLEKGAKLVIPKIDITVQTNNKTVWNNAKDIIKTLKRDGVSEHLISFFRKEINKPINWKTNNKDDGIMIENRTNFKILNNLLRKYIEESVVCKSCRSIDTRLKKNSKTRLWEFTCKSCGQKEYRKE